MECPLPRGPHYTSFWFRFMHVNTRSKVWPKWAQPILPQLFISCTAPAFHRASITHVSFLDPFPSYKSAEAVSPSQYASNDSQGTNRNKRQTFNHTSHTRHTVSLTRGCQSRSRSRNSNNSYPSTLKPPLAAPRRHNGPSPTRPDNRFGSLWSLEPGIQRGLLSSPGHSSLFWVFSSVT